MLFSTNPKIKTARHWKIFTVEEKRGRGPRGVCTFARVRSKY